MDNKKDSKFISRNKENERNNLPQGHLKMKTHELLCEKFGVETQGDKLCEEAAELFEAISRNESRQKVLHEFADVLIVLRSIRYQYNFEESEIDKAVNLKLEKAKGYLNE